MRNMARVALLFALIVASPKSFAAVAANTCTTCYIDYENGNDSWSGTAPTSQGNNIGPWKHLPGMLGISPSGASTGDGCSKNCASQAPRAGDKYILKGGVVWPYTTMPISWTWSGTSSTTTWGCTGSGCIYVGNAVGAGLPGWNKGVVTSITLSRDLGGWNPASPPTISCTSGGGSGAAATPLVMPSAATDPLIRGFIYHINLTSGGSGYTAAPTCTVSGNNSYGTSTAVLAADIDRPILDSGALLASPPDWPCGQNNYTSPQDKPGFGIYSSYTIVYGVEARNLLCNEPSGGRGPIAPIGNSNGYQNVGIYHGYVHGVFEDCLPPNQTVPPSGTPISCPGLSNDSTSDVGILVYSPHDEAAYNIVENGDTFVLSTSAMIANGLCATSGDGANRPCEHGAMGIETLTQNNYGPVSIHNNQVIGGSWQIRLVGTNASGITDPWLVYNNEVWLSMYDYAPTGHINRRYSQLQANQTLISYNNIDHNHVEGSGNQQTCNPGTTFYFFNEVVWGTGTSTPPWTADVADGSGGCTFYLLNSTAYNPTFPQCYNSLAGTSNVTTSILQNNQCLGTTAANPWFSVNSSGNVVKNYAGSTTTSVIQASSVVDTIANANGQGYVASSLYIPTTSGSETVAFANTNANGTNLTSLCSGYLAPLCQDINGNPRPSSGAWQAGAYVGPTAPAPTGLTATVN